MKMMEKNTEIQMSVKSEKGMAAEISETAESFLQKIKDGFNLSEKDIEYIISKTPLIIVGERKEKLLLGSLALFIRCSKSKTPPMTVKLITQVLYDYGYRPWEKTIWNGMKLLRKYELYPLFCPVSELKLLDTYSSFLIKQMEITEKTIEKTREILEKSMKANIAINASPVSRIAGALYIASFLTGERNAKTTQREMANIFSISTIAIRNAHKELTEGLDIEIIL